jgi:hypothetical protein
MQRNQFIELKKLLQTFYSSVFVISRLFVKKIVTIKTTNVQKLLLTGATFVRILS